MASPAPQRVAASIDVAALFATMQTQTNARAALTLARADLPVFPCLPGGKTPLTRHGFLDATADLRQVSSWWGRWPDANLGLPTGPMSSVEVVDIDVRPGGDGHGAFDAAARRVGADGWTARVATPSGGCHLYFPAASGRLQSSWACGVAHVDFRGAGGYIIVPPSTIQIDGQAVPYRLTGSQADPHPVDAQRLRDALDPGLAERRIARRVSRDPMAPDVSRLAAWVAGRPQGERNQGLFYAACRLAEAGHDRATALSALTGAAQQAGLLDREITTTVASAYRTAQPGTTIAPPPACAPVMAGTREAVAL
ncbi:MAG: bifunctional DNA primase/polymerase [Micrococcales bacterium]|nr:bifunctional DNA primase/polymerase [Micrococcales bacterium]